VVVSGATQIRHFVRACDAKAAALRRAERRDVLTGKKNFHCEGAYAPDSRLSSVV